MELRGWIGLCNQLNHYIPGLAGEQAECRKPLKKNVQITVTDQIEREFEATKKAMGNNNSLNSFDVHRRSLVITNASGEGFGHIVMQKKNEHQHQAQGTNTAEKITRDTGWA